MDTLTKNMADPEIHIAFVLDESGSIDGMEEQDIRDALAAFVNAQANSNTTLSLIGMSASDKDTRSTDKDMLNDHILEKRIADEKENFLKWISTYKKQRVSIRSDYWMSGLSVISQLKVTPDIIIIITDGLQAKSPKKLETLYKSLNADSHIFVYGVETNSYKITPTKFTTFVPAIDRYLGRPATEKEKSLPILQSDYLVRSSFKLVGADLALLANDLLVSGIGIRPNTDIIDSNILLPAISVGLTVPRTNSGSILLKNKSRLPLRLAAGTKINSSAAINGLVFTLRDTVTVNPFAQLEAAVVVEGRVLAAGSFSELISLQNVNNPSRFAIAFKVATKAAGCEIYMALVVDESGSIDPTEAQQIRTGLTAFINAQLASNITLSLIGMSESDVNNRQDHILERRIATNSNLFLNWINNYRTSRVGAQADYWASGLSVINSLATSPDIIIVVTDGSQINNAAVLQNLYRDLNANSHIFVYGLNGNLYQINTGFVNFLVALQFYLNRPPVAKTSTNSILAADYISYDNFDLLATQLTGLTNELVTSGVGCIANVDIIENNLGYPSLSVGATLINAAAGFLTLKNKSRIALTLPAGTAIHLAPAIDGLFFTLRDTVTINANAQLDVAVVINGTVVSEGPFSRLITIQGVNNPSQFAIEFNVVKSGITITDKTVLQSSSLYLQAAGSLGTDSTKGIHLRWLLKDGLAAHLPKGNYATSAANFNKPEDFVKIYRARYIENRVTIDFNAIPDIIEDSNGLWIYRVRNRNFHVYFRNRARYNLVRGTVNPATQPLLFVKNYGSEIIEIENKTELGFAVGFDFIETYAPTIKIELLSVENNNGAAPKLASYRKVCTGPDIVGKKLLSENIRSIRLKAESNFVARVHIELYSLLIEGINRGKGFGLMGKFALTLDTPEAHKRLEPQPGIVHGKWLRYNDAAYVNIENYKDRWEGTPGQEDKIKTTVDRYITLSNNAANPMANETIHFNDPNQTPMPGYEPDPSFDPDDNTFDISNLYLLNLASLDYHIARMLGLGTLDIDTAVFEGQYIYLAAYTSFGDLKDGLGAREVQHIYTSLPVSLTDQRLPMAIDLKEIKPGIFTDYGTESPAILTDADGYSQDGKTRFLTLFNQPLPDETADAAFFYKNVEFVSSDTTLPVYAGIEYKKQGEANWQKPELPYHSKYQNIDTTVTDPLQKRETISIVVPEHGNPLFVHRERNSGLHAYSTYGINWFSRAKSSAVIETIDTLIKPSNTLLPPTNINAQLIQKENPIVFTSQQEQAKYTAIGTDDKTLIRLTFEYTHGQELIDYHTQINETPINGVQILANHEELFAEDVEIFFRNRVPAAVSGKVMLVEAVVSNPLLCKITTGKYDIISSGINPVTGLYNEVVVPSIPVGTESNYIGSILLINQNQFVVHQIDNTGTFPVFTVLKAKRNGEAISLNSTLPDSELLIPSEGGLFALIENMLSIASWELPNPHSLKIKTEPAQIHSEAVFVKNTDGNNETHFQKFRGVYQDAIVEKVLEQTEENGMPVTKHLGVYKITFPGYQLAQHSQYSNTGPGVSFYNGVVRLHTDKSDGQSQFNGRPKGVRKDLKVIRTENIGTAADLVVYAIDGSFPPVASNAYDYIKTGNTKVNYYPGYKVYLYKDVANGITKEKILPPTGSDIRYSIFGLRSHSVEEGFVSKMSVPVLMFAQAITEPVRPQKPSGGMYATRPDFFGKSSYTFTTKYGTVAEPHQPYAVQFNRASDVQFLSAVYDNSVLGNDANNEPILNTVQQVMAHIFLDGEENFYVDRWSDFLSFTYPSGAFAGFEGRTLPMPNNPNFIRAINAFIDAHNEFYHLVGPAAVPHLPGGFNLNTVVIPASAQNAELKLKDFLKDTLLNCFVPLTEIPVIYMHVKDGSYQPVPKKQKVRDRNGNLLDVTDPDFDMAPMMKRLDAGGAFESQFTDFGLDGASNATYFYAVREINLQMKTSDYSPIIGPVSLVNTAPPTAPEILKIIPLLENRALGIKPAIQLQINAYPLAQQIRKINIYRADNATDALSIRTMQQAKVIDLEVAGLSNESKWVFTDDFSDLTEVPFGDILFYRLTVSRVIKYNDSSNQLIVDYAPSEASKLVITNIAENYNPESPVLNYNAELYNPAMDAELRYITLTWDETAYKAHYHLYKMNAQGNWVEIARVMADRTRKGRYQVYNTDTQGNWVGTIHPSPIHSNSGTIYLPLEQTDLATNSLATKTADGNPIFHHFKVLAENTAGMFSTKENILTMYNADSYNAIGGIGTMIVQGTFIIR
jgi:hypothetical protein